MAAVNAVPAVGAARPAAILPVPADRTAPADTGHDSAFLPPLEQADQVWHNLVQHAVAGSTDTVVFKFLLMQWAALTGLSPTTALGRLGVQEGRNQG